MDIIITEKKCTKCGKRKNISQFNNKKSTKDGLTCWCKSCCVEDASRWIKENPKRHMVFVKKWQVGHIENIRRATKKWRLSQPDDYRESQRKSSKKYYDNHSEKWYLSKFLRRSRVAKNGGNFTAQEWKALKEFYNLSCLRCGRREPDIKLSPDHVNPVAKGGSNSIENIQPLCVSCNKKKYTKETDYRFL